jgi:hypothetical protein
VATVFPICITKNLCLDPPSNRLQVKHPTLVFTLEPKESSGRGSSAEPSSTIHSGASKKLHFRYIQSHGDLAAEITKQSGLMAPPLTLEKRAARFPTIKLSGPNTIFYHILKVKRLSSKKLGLGQGSQSWF